MKSIFELAEIFNDNMVFQSGKPIKIFGKCKKNLEMSFKLLNEEITIKTKSETFLVEFPAMDYRDLGFSFSVTAKKEKVTIYNCLVGDVYLFLGGMNINMPLADSHHNQEVDNQNVRFFSKEGETYDWSITRKENFENFSALGYLFSKSMHEIVKNPIGVINCTHIKSTIFSWMSNSDIAIHKEINHITSKFDPKDKLPLYSNLKEKIVPHQVKAIIFYQGENDYPYYSVYEDAIRSIIKCLRFDFNDLRIPFFTIQIAGYNHPEADDYSVSKIRMAQARVTSEKDEVYLVSAIDFGDPEEINPKDKHLVAQRLTNLVLEKIFKIGKNNTSPSYFSYQVYPDNITILTQDNYLNLVSRSNQYLGFTYTENGVDFHPLEGIKIESNRIIINKEKEYKEIRYAMKKFPVCDIITTNNLPLLPFYIKF